MENNNTVERNIQIVKHILVKQDNQPIVKLKTINNATVRCTPRHKRDGFSGVP